MRTGARLQIRSGALALFVAALGGLTATRVGAQDLEPRSYSPAPIGATFVLFGFGRSQGPILMDPSLNVDNVEGDLWIATPGFGRVFGVAGRQARILVVVPVARGRIEGEVLGQRDHQDLAGAVDPRIKFSIGLHGAPALTLSEFVNAPRRRTVVGASLTVVPPWGAYEPGQLVNLGYHRWALKPELGVSRQLGRWTLDGYAGIWLFTENSAYFPSHAIRRQAPVVALQGHASYALTRRVWIALDGTWFGGGQTQVNGVLNPDLQRNSRIGATWSVPLSGSQSLKFTYSAGASTRRGSAFDTVNVTWQLVTFGANR